MKIRTGFVSNSSSSSFVCSVCGEVASGWDGEYGFETKMCNRGHEWCADHSKNIPEPTTQEKRSMLLLDKDWMKWADQESQTAIKAGVEDVIDDYFEDYICDGLPEHMCPVCSLHTITNEDMLKYMLKYYNETRADVEKEIKSKFANLRDFEDNV